MTPRAPARRLAENTLRGKLSTVRGSLPDHARGRTLPINDLWDGWRLALAGVLLDKYADLSDDNTIKAGEGFRRERRAVDRKMERVPRDPVWRILWNLFFSLDDLHNDQAFNYRQLGRRAARHYRVDREAWTNQEHAW
ncbi:hypothetical protein Rhopal_006129-T1 [Rhodotorula paludigena]|uniref:Uncharacterized protein n=1 Tax=Rhodotorula paludigena TaxID=86838 RepID=A0AAV5GRE7_9BASI|nr:hypothetical protein Rhopal_006129-T1 [Rhodotorula paludigena]